MKPVWSSSVMVGLALAVLACSDSSGPSEDPGDEVATVIVSGFTFSPATRTVARGTTVRWVNNTTVFHTVTPDGHSQWASTNLPANSNFEHTFNTAGTYEYFCTPHKAGGMAGTIIVQ